MYAFHGEAFYKALTAVVEARGASWRQVARDCGIEPSTLSRMSRGRGINGDTLATLSAWAGLNPNDFVRKKPLLDQPREHSEPSDSHRAEPGALTEIFQLLRANTDLSASAVAALEDIITAAYQGLRTR